jgi:site-specific recombinase XerD
MILGRGPAQTDAEIVAEYQQFVCHSTRATSSTILTLLHAAPGALGRRIGKPLSLWTDEDILTACAAVEKQSSYRYLAFVSFLLFRGYRAATISFLTALPHQLVRMHRAALEPFRQKLAAVQKALGYFETGVGTELNLLLMLLAVIQKPLEEVTRAEFDRFRDEYQHWYRSTNRQAKGQPDHRMFRLEYYFVHWQILPSAVRVYRHEAYFAQLRHEPIRTAIMRYMQWCSAKYKDSTMHSQRAAITNFFLWTQAHCPEVVQLDQVQRTTALAYATYLKAQRDTGVYSLTYCADMYRCLRQFYEFAITENLETVPTRNPFGPQDLGKTHDPVPRYLSDQEMRTILSYLDRDATLVERTLVTVLLHTGIRAAELAALKTTDIVQIHGTWKLHIHEGKGLKDRVIPLTARCLAALQTWQEQGWERISERLFTRHGRAWKGSGAVLATIRGVSKKAGVPGLTPHRFRHTFAVALINYGVRESALQKLMGHANLDVTLEYGRILDHTVEQAFGQAVEQMQEQPHSWVPSFFAVEEYSTFVEADAVSWIRLPHGYCRRNPKLHCESDVKCLLCDRYRGSAEDLPRLQAMHDRFVGLGMDMKAAVVAAQIQRLTQQEVAALIPLESIQIHRQTEIERSPMT